MYNSVNKYFKVLVLATAFLGLTATTAFAQKPGHYGLGEIATEVEIAGWDIDIRPDGQGLPEGSGSVSVGEGLYDAQCASCHGSFGEGAGRWPKLAGGIGTLTHERPEKTVGSYWPYASTLYDYIRRAMPFTSPQSLTADETYAITAYVLYLNELVEDDFTLSKSNFTTIVMPNAEGFFEDDRPDVRNKTCMKDCKDPASIKVVSTIAGVTPLEHLKEGAEIELASAGDIHGKGIYEKSCAVCHDSGVAGAPIVGEKDIWADRMERGMEAIVGRAITGYVGDYGVMPAKGGNMSLSDEDVAAAVHYMIEQSQ
ncbi:MAG: cytochrome c5 [Methylophagaceae bacterium]|jgi:cytochrome c5